MQSIYLACYVIEVIAHKLANKNSNSKNVLYLNTGLTFYLNKMCQAVWLLLLVWKISKNIY